MKDGSRLGIAVGMIVGAELGLVGTMVGVLVGFVGSLVGTNVGLDGSIVGIIVGIEGIVVGTDIKCINDWIRKKYLIHHIHTT